VVGDTAHLRWFVRHGAPPAVESRIRATVSAQRPVN
jgi:hypothetical protein